MRGVSRSTLASRVFSHAGQATGLAVVSWRCDEPPLRDSAGISPDFAELCVPTIAGSTTITPPIPKRKWFDWVGPAHLVVASRP